ncbi:MAG: hypothetical protein LBN00_10810 [Oscillospiraceae bacterium]|jgi:regulator of replication initiation timing|nr:hypothetical protein [Oscillospiraceae bacterium]
MSERTSIRTSIVGGFDRQDVIDNIKRISGERNAIAKELNAVKAQLADALAANEGLHYDLDTAIALRVDAENDAELARAEAAAAKAELAAYKVSEQTKAAELIGELETQLRALRENLL